MNGRINAGLALSFVLSACAEPPSEPTLPSVDASAPTLIVTGARIWTGNDRQPWAQALAVRDDTIIAVGSDADVAALAAADTETIAAAGGMVVPGFIDTHVHLFDGGQALASVQLRDARTPDEFRRRFARFVETIEPGEWILGGAWDHENWGGELPVREWIDAVTPDNPVFVHRLDGHMALANTRALEAAGVDAMTDDIAGGEIVRDANGEPTGVLKDNAMPLIQRVIPPFTDTQRDRHVAAAMDYFVGNGVTTVHDMADFDSLAAYRRAHDRGTMKVRIYSLVPLSKWPQLADDVARNGNGDHWLRTGGLKGFVDGSLGSHTAAFFEPYTDTPGDRGMLINDPADLRDWIDGADRAGLHVAVHAIGDRAIRDLLDIFRDVARANGPRDRRFRIEHVQHPHPDDINRFAALEVIASMQPYHAIDDGRWAERVIGPERAKTTYAFRSLIDSGARVAFGSDWYVAPATPLQGIYAAVTRRTLDGANPEGWVPGEKISVEEALIAYTVQAAYASYDEDQKGRIAPGYLADFVVLADDLTAIDPVDIADVKILRTVVGGQTVYRADQAPRQLVEQ